MAKTEVIKISTELKAALDAAKGDLTFADYLDDMLNIRQLPKPWSVVFSLDKKLDDVLTRMESKAVTGG